MTETTNQNSNPLTALQQLFDQEYKNGYYFEDLTISINFVPKDSNKHKKSITLTFEN